MTKQILEISGMTCNHCVMALKKEFTDSSIVVVDASIGSATIEFDEKKFNAEKISSIVAEAGFQLTAMKEVSSN